MFAVAGLRRQAPGLLFGGRQIAVTTAAGTEEAKFPVAGSGLGHVRFDP